MRRSNGLLVLWLLLAPAAALGAAAAPPALRLEAGSVARRQLVAVGRDLLIHGDALSDVAALNGSVEVSGHVAGDVIVLGGEARILAGAQVDGDVFALGGTIVTAPGAQLGGRAVAYPSLSSAWLTLLEGPNLGPSAASPTVLGAKLALLAAWSLLLLLLFATSGSQLLQTSEAVRHRPLRCLFSGLVGVLALLLTALLFSSFAAAVIGVPLLVLVIVLALMLKLWGMAAVFHALGSWLVHAARRRRFLPLHAASLGLVLLGALKFVPWVGTWAWTAATLIGVGATLSSKFGRQEPWFSTAPP